MRVFLIGELRIEEEFCRKVAEKRVSWSPGETWWVLWAYVGVQRDVYLFRTYTDLNEWQQEPAHRARSMFVPCGLYSSASSSQLYRSCCRVL